MLHVSDLMRAGIVLTIHFTRKVFIRWIVRFPIYGRPTYMPMIVH